ncbi:MAG: hypothetical protein AB7U83_19990 [Vicinamibacterales bacterium]
MPGPERSRDGVAAWLCAELPARAAPWLAGQRWFGGKARAIAGVAVEDVVWLPDDGDPVALVALLVDYAADGTGAPPRRERYAVVAGAASEAGAAALAPWPDGGGRHLADLATAPGAVRALLAGLAGGGTLPGERGGVVRYRDASPAARQLTGAATLPPVVPVGVEQSNTSLRIGASHVFKLFRRLEEGENPQLEIGRFLAAVDFTAAPRLEGSLEYQPPGGRGCALGALEGWVPNRGDGWRHVVTRLTGDGAGADGLSASMRGELAELGDVTAAFHAALASRPDVEGFAPVPVTPDHVRHWRRQVAAQAARTMALLARPDPSWPRESLALATTVLDAGPRIALAGPADDDVLADGFDAIRIHGDYHLGQTLRTDRGFTIIDFEGEPSKPLDERRQHHCALKDVAGMLRSFDYAAATAAGAAGAASALQMRQAFLDGYRAAADRHHARYLPAGADARAAWTRLFELEKALYEVEYELNNRPAWAPIPLAALARLVGAS